ncbi:MAG: PAS domain S-box protein, partial [Flavobacteriales bacterium]
MKQTVPIRILIVEDFHAETDALLIELRDVDMLFEQEVVKNEKQYQDALATFEPDVILSPYSLKGTNAIKLLGIAKKAGVDAPFILLAFDLSEDIAIDLLGEGIEDYVQHSTLKRLPVAIKKALQRYKTQLELKISESRLKTSEESLRNMVKNTPIAVAMFDQQMNYLVVSDAWLKHENRKEKELIGNNHYDIVPELPEHWKKIHQEVLGGKTHESNSETMMRSNGSSEILRWRMNPWYTSEGAVGGAVLFIENITDTIQAQLRVERNEHLLAIGEELGHSGSFEFDIATQTPVWSRNMYKIKGFELGADISHESYIKHIHPEDKDHYLDAYVQITQSVAPTLFEYRIFRPDNGKVVHLRVHSSFITNEAGEPTALMGSVQDITESVQARTSLEESEASLKSAQQIAKIGSWTLNPTDNSVTWTKELFAIHGIKEQKLEVE